MGWNQSSIIGRIRWVRSLFACMNAPMEALKDNDCVIQHKKAQLCVKYYNYMSSVLLHYELLYHKAWHDYADQIRAKLELPVLVKDSETNLLQVNLSKYVPQMIKETESMWQLGLEVPEQAATLAYCKHKVLDVAEGLKEMIKRNDKLRRNIPIQLLNLMRTQLLALENVFAPGLSTITWLSQDMEMYLKRTDKALIEVECFLKRANDIVHNRIEGQLKHVARFQLIFFPEDPIDSAEFYHINSDYRSKQGKTVETKTLTK